MHVSVRQRVMGFTLLWFVLLSSALPAQDEQKESQKKKNGLPQIADEPKTVDPATIMPKKLAALVTVNFTDASLREVAQWIQQEQKLPVLLDNAALSDAGISLGELITDHLKNEPLYLLLNRLTSLELAWYVEDDILHITTMAVAEDRMATETYNLGDLLDAGYKPDDLLDTILSATEGPWYDIDGVGGDMDWLGDVLFVRHTDRVQRRVRGLLAALRKHGRQTFALDPPQHMLLRQKLSQNVSVKFQDTPLSKAMQELAEQTKADIRLDRPALREEGIRDRQPVSLTLSDRKLSTVLRVLLEELNLTWILKDGVLWITTVLSAEERRKTAVYDVRDLCRDQQESAALRQAIQRQAGGSWLDTDGTGGAIAFPRSGTMVVRHSEEGLREVRELLATYRKALLASKRRERDAVDPNPDYSRLR